MIMIVNITTVLNSIFMMFSSLGGNISTVTKDWKKTNTCGKSQHVKKNELRKQIDVKHSGSPKLLHPGCI